MIGMLCVSPPVSHWELKCIIGFVFMDICSSGIGRATALALVRCGAEVTAVTRTQSDLDTLVLEV